MLKDFITPVSSLETLIDGQGIEKLNILSLSGEERIELEVKINRLGEIAFASSFPIVKGANGNLEMTNKNATKGFAVKGLCNALNIDHTNVMCFGDGENDIEMLEFAGIGVAMGNAEGEVKAVADYVTTDIDEDGVANALKHFGLI